MKVKRPPLAALRAFEAVARLGSFLLAAEELFVTPSAVSYQVKSLEAFLGFALFRRTKSGVALTDEGRAYFQAVQSAFEQINEATAHAIQGQLTNTLFIRSSSSFAYKWLMPRLASFLAIDPTLNLRIDTNRTRWTKSERCDIEIRFGDGPSSEMHVEPLVTECISPMCSPALIERVGKPERLSDLGRFPILQTRENLVPWNTWMEVNGLALRLEGREVSFDRAYMAIDAAVRGLGVILEGDFIAREELESGQLVELFESAPKPVRCCRHFLVYSHAQAEAEKVRSFANWIRERLHDEGERLDPPEHAHARRVVPLQGRKRRT